MIDIILFLLAIYNFYAVYIFLRVSKKILANKIAVSNKPEIVEEVDFQKLIHEINSEIHYFYDERNKQFICQGATLSDAANNYTKIQGIDKLGVFVNLENQKIFCFLNNQCMEFVVDE
jgi:hypothetical protein